MSSIMQSLFKKFIEEPADFLPNKKISSILNSLFCSCSSKFLPTNPDAPTIANLDIRFFLDYWN